MDLFCSNCGNRLREGAKFCNKCGSKVNTDDILDNNQATDSYSAPQPSNNNQFQKEGNEAPNNLSLNQPNQPNVNSSNTVNQQSNHSNHNQNNEYHTSENGTFSFGKIIKNC